MRLLVALTIVLALGATTAGHLLAGQDAPKGPITLSVAELIDVYRTAWVQSAARLSEADDAVAKTPEFKRWMDRKKEHAALESRLSAAVLEKTGKVVNWQTGTLVESKAETSSK